MQQRILSHLAQMPHIPVIVIGTEQPGFSLPHFRYINSSDAADLCDLTEHLIVQHGFKDIHILTGPDTHAVSHERVQGYRLALKRHGIAFDENKVFYGNFWTNSGREHAQRYITDELDFPEALICCNNYMAYGFLDECMEQDIPLPEKAAVVGYEYVRERRQHTPLLTTYQRNRRALGEAAFRMLQTRIETGDFGAFEPPSGTLIPGESCGCGAR